MAYQNFMGNKDFHPSSIRNLRKVRCQKKDMNNNLDYCAITQLYEAQEKVKLEEKRQEELREQYLKEQEIYQTKYACGNCTVSDSIPNQSVCLLFSFLPTLFNP